MQNITTIIFDCFGVLYPSFYDEYIPAHKTDDYNPAILDQLNVEIDSGVITLAEFFERLALVLDVSPATIASEREKALVPDENLLSFIRRNRDNYKFGLLSNAGKDEIAVLYDDKVDVLFQATAVSYEVGDIKPNPKIYQTCLERLGAIPGESLFVDDSLKNVTAAQALGMQGLHYSKFGVIPDQLMELLA